MIETIKSWSGVVALVAIILTWAIPSQSVLPVEFGASGTRFPNGISADSTSPNVGQVRGTTLTVTATTTMAGNLVITQSNTATSSVQVGCITTYATSTASPIRLMFFASSTLNIDGASITAGFGGGTNQGLVLWGFGLCPRL